MIIELMTSCALMMGAGECNSEEDKIDKASNAASDILDKTAELKHAPYVDEITAEYERKLNDKDAVIENLESEIKSLEKEAEELASSKDDTGDNVTDDTGVNSPRDISEVEESEVVTESEKDIEAQGQSFEATYYSAYCDTGCTGVTATGEDVSNSNYVDGKRVIAVDPNVIPLGTSVKVTTPNETFDAVAEDTGGDIQGNRIDILVDSTEEAYRLGRHDVQVEIIN